MTPSRSGNGKVSDGKDLRNVIDEILNNNPISKNQSLQLVAILNGRQFR